MRSEVVDWADAVIGVKLEVAPDELGELIANLTALRRDHDQHFHIALTPDQTGRLADIELSVIASGQAHNMRMSSLALPPGAQVPDSQGSSRRRRQALVRPVGAGLLGLVGSLAIFTGAGAAYVTRADMNYRPMLIEGVWSIAFGLLAFHASSVVARSWKGRAVAFAGALLGLAGLVELLRRLVQ